MDDNAHRRIRTVAFILLAALSAFSMGINEAFAVGCSDSAMLAEEAGRNLPVNPSRSEELLLEALWICPDSAALRFDLAMVFYELGRYKEAEAALREAVTIRPDYAKALNALAYVMLTKTGGDRNEAGLYAKTAVDLEPGIAEYRDTLALAGSFSMPPDLRLSVSFKETSGNGVLESGEEGIVSVKITNQGEGSSGALRIRLLPESSASGLDYDAGTDIVSVSPDEERKAELRIRASGSGISSGMANFILKAEEAGGFGPESKKISIAVRPVGLPELSAMIDSITDSDADNRLTKGESFALAVTLANKGRGDARGVTVGMRSGGGLTVSEGVTSLGIIKPGESRRLTYTLKSAPDAQPASASLAVSEERPGFGFTIPVLLAYDTPLEKLVSLNQGAVPAPEARPRPFEPNTDSGGGLGIVISAGFGEGAFGMRPLVAASPGFGDEGVWLFENVRAKDLSGIFGRGGAKGLLQDMADRRSRNIFIYISSEASVTKDGIVVKAAGAEGDGYPLPLLLESIERLSLEKAPESIVIMLDLRLPEGARIEEDEIKKLILPDMPLFLRGGSVLVLGLDYSGGGPDAFLKTFYATASDAMERRAELSAGMFEEALRSAIARGARDFGAYVSGDGKVLIIRKPESK